MARSVMSSEQTVQTMALMVTQDSNDVRCWRHANRLGIDGQEAQGLVEDAVGIIATLGGLLIIGEAIIASGLSDELGILFVNMVPSHSPYAYIGLLFFRLNPPKLLSFSIKRSSLV